MNEAKIYGIDLPISTKKSVEICNFIRHKKLKKAKDMLNSVLQKKVAVPYKRYNRNTPHRKGRIASGRYPVKASSEILKLLEGVEANAQQKGLDVNNLVIDQIIANQASRPFHFGRKRRRKMKRTHIDIVVKEIQKEIKSEEKKK